MRGNDTVLGFRPLTAVILGAAITGGAVLSTFAAYPAQAASNVALTCKASMSTAKPKDHSKVDVNITTKGGASITTAAHYKTSTNTKTAKASASGQASVVYDISSATPGYKVVVDVFVKSGTSHSTCSTSFTPVK
jgi:hypothetical protein